MRGVEDGGLAGVDDRATADREVPVEGPGARERGCRSKRRVGRLDVDLVVHGDIEAGRAHRGERRLHRRKARHRGIGEERDAAASQRAELLAGLEEHAGSKADRRDVDGEDGLVAVDEGVAVAAGHSVREM